MAHALKKSLQSPFVMAYFIRPRQSLAIFKLTQPIKKGPSSIAFDRFFQIATLQIKTLLSDQAKKLTSLRKLLNFYLTLKEEKLKYVDNIVVLIPKYFNLCLSSKTFRLQSEVAIHKLVVMSPSRLGLGSARDLFPLSWKSKIGRNELKI